MKKIFYIAGLILLPILIGLYCYYCRQTDTDMPELPTKTEAPMPITLEAAKNIATVEIRRVFVDKDDCKVQFLDVPKGTNDYEFHGMCDNKDGMKVVVILDQTGRVISTEKKHVFPESEARLLVEKLFKECTHEYLVMCRFKPEDLVGIEISRMHWANDIGWVIQASNPQRKGKGWWIIDIDRNRQVTNIANCVP